MFDKNCLLARYLDRLHVEGTGTKRDLQARCAQAEVARRLDVSRQSVSVWAKQLSGLDGQLLEKRRFEGTRLLRSVRQPQGQTAGPAQVTGRRAVRGAVCDARQRCASCGISHGGLDGQTGARADRAGNRRQEEQYRRLGVIAQARLLAAKAGETRTATRRAGHRDVEAQELVCAKKIAA